MVYAMLLSYVTISGGNRPLNSTCPLSNAPWYSQGRTSHATEHLPFTFGKFLGSEQVILMNGTKSSPRYPQRDLRLKMTQLVTGGVDAVTVDFGDHETKMLIAGGSLR